MRGGGSIEKSKGNLFRRIGYQEAIKNGKTKHAFIALFSAVILKPCEEIGRI
jgi:hypothetical protein